MAFDVFELGYNVFMNVTPKDTALTVSSYYRVAKVTHVRSGTSKSHEINNIAFSYIHKSDQCHPE